MLSNKDKRKFQKTQYMIGESPKEIISKMYENFKANEKNFWLDRFTYKKDRKNPFPMIDLCNFGRETHAFKSINRKMSPTGFLSVIDELILQYIPWAKTKDIKCFDDEDWKDLGRWLKGVLGEYFYYCVLSDLRCLYISLNGTNEVTRFDFNNICPVLDTDDFGVDFVGLANDIPSVFQIKTWSDYNAIASMTIYRAAFGEGIARNYINQNEAHNTFLCWFGREDNGLMNVKNDDGFNERVVCIGSSTLNDAINKRNEHFWDEFYDSLSYIENF